MSLFFTTMVLLLIIVFEFNSYSSKLIGILDKGSSISKSLEILRLINA